jgi:hypothetical protein
MAYNPTLNHLAIVEHYRNRLPHGTNDDCVYLCAAIANELRAQGETDAGLLTKTAGENHGVGPDGQRYAVDIIAYRDSARHFDCLVAAPERAEPAWQDKGGINAAAWRAPFPTDPIDPDVPDEPDVPDTGGGSDVVIAVLAKLDAIEQAIHGLDRTLREALPRKLRF